MEPAADSYDLIVIGGGINGAGIARDAALRGIRVLLLEAADFGGGTSSWSSRLIHGGLRYLEYGEIPLVYESLHERRNLRRIAPHLVRPIRINIPLYRNGRRPRWLVRLGMLAYDLLSIGKALPGHHMLNRDELRAATPGINAEGLLGCAQYYDAQVTFAERLVIENVIAAAGAGADVRNYSPVTGIAFNAGSRIDVRYADQATGATRQASASHVVNAAGPWVDRVLATSSRVMPTLMGGTKGSHIVVSPFTGAPDDAFYVEAAADGRPVFILPWNGLFLIGTTDIRYAGDPADAQASQQEIDYLLAATNDVFPRAGLTRDAIHYAYAGIRPLPQQTKGPESAITRRHILHQHKGNAKGLLSVIGGKLTTYRNLAEQVVDRVAASMHAARLAPCETATTPLPGGAAPASARAALDGIEDLSLACRDRLLSIYGSRAVILRELIDREPVLARCIDDAGRVLAAEVAMAFRHEFAASLVDVVHRRQMTGLSANAGRDTYARLLRLAAVERGWSDAEAERQFLELEAYNRRLRPPFAVNQPRA